LDKTEARYAEIAGIMQETINGLFLKLIMEFFGQTTHVYVVVSPLVMLFLALMSLQVPGFPSFQHTIIDCYSRENGSEERCFFYLPGFILWTMPKF
jgi:hypothetical protein